MSEPAALPKTRLLQGFVAGLFAAALAAFASGAWTLTSTSERQVSRKVHSAVVAALAPICADRFRQAADYKSSLIALESSQSWLQATALEKGGWSTFAGTQVPLREVAEACVLLLIPHKSE